MNIETHENENDFTINHMYNYFFVTNDVLYEVLYICLNE